MGYEGQEMTKSKVNFKDIGPLLIILVIVALSYVSVRQRANWNRDRINELVAAQSKLQSQVNEIERREAGTRVAVPAAPPPSPAAPSKTGDLSIRVDGVEDPELKPPLQQWMQALSQAYEPLKKKHKPPTGRAIVGRVMFDAKGKVTVFDYIKAPENKALGKALATAIRKTPIKKPAEKLAIKLPLLSVHLSFEP